MRIPMLKTSTLGEEDNCKQEIPLCLAGVRGQDHMGKHMQKNYNHMINDTLLNNTLIINTLIINSLINNTLTR